MPTPTYLTIPRKAFARMQRVYRKWILRDYIDEVDLVFKGFFKTENPSVMYDIGAHQGSSLEKFAQAGWRIEAFEPDQGNFEILKRKASRHSKVKLHPIAVGAEDKESVDFYQSPESSGVSGLSAFLDSHTKSQQVRLVTLSTFASETSASTPDFLKIDTEGHDLFVLKGYPWKLSSPRIIVCEFEDSKTATLGYDFNQLRGFLEDKGYSIIVSEWYPIESYGAQHRWKGFYTNQHKPLDPAAWGNIIAFHDPIDYTKALELWPIKERNNP